MFFGLPDYKGTISDVVNSSGVGVNHGAFNSFGAITTGTMAADYLFGLAGMNYDPQTGLYRTQERLYSPAMGRFLSPDPFLASRSANCSTFRNRL